MKIGPARVVWRGFRYIGFKVAELLGFKDRELLDDLETFKPYKL
jgi:hypothetical protein